MKKYSIRVLCYHTGAITVEVEADTLAEACAKAVESSGNLPDWKMLDEVSPSFVFATNPKGEIPAEFGEGVVIGKQIGATPLTDREKETILTAMRYWESRLDQSAPNVPPLTISWERFSALCERLSPASEPVSG